MIASRTSPLIRARPSAMSCLVSLSRWACIIDLSFNSSRGIENDYCIVSRMGARSNQPCGGRGAAFCVRIAISATAGNLTYGDVELRWPPPIAIHRGFPLVQPRPPETDILRSMDHDCSTTVLNRFSR
jgi:hypothetical protein